MKRKMKNIKENNLLKKNIYTMVFIYYGLLVRDKRKVYGIHIHVKKSYPSSRI